MFTVPLFYVSWKYNVEYNQSIRLMNEKIIITR
jgi:hypothetical protein